MAIGELCSREVVFVSKSESAADAARLMREHHIGSVVVAERKGERLGPARSLRGGDLGAGGHARARHPPRTRGTAHAACALTLGGGAVAGADALRLHPFGA